MRFLQVALLLLFNYLDSLPKLYIYINLDESQTAGGKQGTNLSDTLLTDKWLWLQYYLIQIA